MVLYGLQTALIMTPLLVLAFGAIQQPIQVTVRDKAKWRRSIAVAMSGGIAGGIATGLLYPIDTLKTIRQSDRALQSASTAFETLRKNGVVSLYSGVVPAALGSIPSSALYFGAYEGAKQWLYENFGHGDSSSTEDNSLNKIKGELKIASSSNTVGRSIHGGMTLSRPVIHMLAAATGNIASSLIFVPKEAIKQKLQAINTGAIKSLATSGSIAAEAAAVQSNVGACDVVRHIWSTAGVKGFYPSYRATLMRNIPSAVVRFTVYEELKHIGGLNVGENKVGILLVGAAASALSSACTTPLDVVKTRLATGKLARGTKVFTAISDIAKKEGPRGLYSGVQERAVWSALFGGVGLASFETCKKLALRACDDLENVERGEEIGSKRGCWR